MAEKSTIAKMYTDLVTAFQNVITTKAIFCGGRPNFGEDEKPPKRILVIELPVTIEDYAVGKKKFLLNTTGVVYLFDKAKKDTTLNVDSTSDFTESVVDLFPIVGSFFSAVNPKVLMRGADEYGYQLVTVTFDIHSK